jgi:hypothetical protein
METFSKFPEEYAIEKWTRSKPNVRLVFFQSLQSCWNE